MTPPVANRPPEVTHHAPRHPGADHHNAVLAAAQARVDVLEPKLAAVLEPILRRVGTEAARRFKQFATHHASLYAAGPLTGVKPTSTMICVRPRPEEAAAVADPDGAPASDLHCTLVFLGEIEGPLDEIRAAIAGVAGSHAPLAGVVGGYGEFRPPDCGILLPDVPGLVELRVAVTEALVAAGIDYSRDHGWQPHITVDGDPEDGEIDYMLDRVAQSPLHFDALLIVRGDTETLELPLVGPRPVTAAGDTPPDWTPPAADELVDTDALAAAFRGKTDPIRLALIEDVLGSVFGVPGVTEEEAIAFYHSPKAFELNEALRSGRALTAEQQHVINALDAAMRPSEDDMVLYRGVPNAADVFGTSSLSKLEGSTFTTPGYVSTSELEETADQFAAGIAGAADKPLVQEIRVPKGTPMLRIPAGDYGDQQEWLLPREVRFGMGTAVREDDPFGSQTIYAKSTALNKGILSASTAGVAEGAGLSFDVANPLIDGLLAKTGQHITGIADTTQANVMRAVGSAYQSGLTIPDTAKLITQVMHEAAGPRSVMIARTEMTSAVNGASLAAAQLIGEQTGAKMTKTWLTAPGAQFPRHEDYDDLDGQTVGQDETFTVGEDELQYPGDPDGSPEEVINCRCAMTYSDGSEVDSEA
jgi:2'-5' RNA ligase